MKIRLISKKATTRIVSRRWLEKRSSEIVKRLPKQVRVRVAPELTCVLVSASEIRALNKKYRGKDRATDVLSFSAVEPNSLGELVFCTSVIRKQAREHGLTCRNEFLYMLIHGILHLLGYEHEKSDKRARVMYRLQDRIFEQLAPPKRKQLGKRNAKNVNRHRTV